MYATIVYVDDLANKQVHSFLASHTAQYAPLLRPTVLCFCMSQKGFDMLKKSRFRFICNIGVIAGHGARKCRAAIIFCFLPFICKSSSAGSGEELSEILCCKINSANEITHSVSSPIITIPVFFGLLKKN